MRAPLLFLAALSLLAGAPALAQDKQHPIAAEVKASVKDATKPFTMIISLQAKAGTGDKFEAAFKPAIAATLKEKGCLAYDLSRDAKKPTEYLLYERWENLAALEAHLKTAHIETLLKEVGPLLEGPPAVRVLVPAAEGTK